ncbi:response regulator transcription factor [Streptomyces sp. A0958]|uniref:response regulator transcription factor n=1 Tax=Streptomyces sp. A0958 TaxID=2563101 RepID=UPI00109E4C30|nr:response regulator transcription factor [Streptomyces sp. A0958]THA71166.1 response regulator transcription factor [Streptomyces sp. A0958]
MHRVLLAGGPALVRDAYARVIAASPAFAHPAQTATLTDALAGLTACDLLLVDAQELFQGPPSAAQIRLRHATACTRVVVLGNIPPAELPFLTGAGVTGVLGPNLEPDDFLTALDVILGGAMVISPAPAHTAPPPALRGTLTPLTQRELEVLTLIATQPDNTAIAKALVVSPLTVKSHINRIMHKLAASSRSQLVVLAYESRLIIPGTPVDPRATDAESRAQSPRPGQSS